MVMVLMEMNMVLCEQKRQGDNVCQIRISRLSHLQTKFFLSHTTPDTISNFVRAPRGNIYMFLYGHMGFVKINREDDYSSNPICTTKILLLLHYPDSTVRSIDLSLAVAFPLQHGTCWVAFADDPVLLAAYASSYR
ncbi:hypothetical protein L1049_009735 [Liquidambar formosana]|uniref:Uncharacterized protein n=1 Tax=Liquidambar formosana TaxID=63359 RepID=A0AAP0R0V8_LIQFO